MNKSQGITIYILLLTFIALLFFPEAKFSSSIYSIFDSFGELFNGLKEPGQEEDSLFKLIFFCLLFLFFTKLITSKKE